MIRVSFVIHNEPLSISPGLLSEVTFRAGPDSLRVWPLIKKTQRLESWTFSPIYPLLGKGWGFLEIKLYKNSWTM